MLHFGHRLHSAPAVAGIGGKLAVENGMRVIISLVAAGLMALRSVGRQSPAADVSLRQRARTMPPDRRFHGPARLLRSNRAVLDHRGAKRRNQRRRPRPDARGPPVAVRLLDAQAAFLLRRPERGRRAQRDPDRRSPPRARSSTASIASPSPTAARCGKRRRTRSACTRRARGRRSPSGRGRWAAISCASTASAASRDAASASAQSSRRSALRLASAST